MQVEIGQIAPNFALFNTEKNKESLSDYKGKEVVLLSFPLAFSGVCTKEMSSIRDTMSVYNALDVVVIGISVDSLFTLDKFKKEHQLEFTLLSDFNKEAATAYGCLTPTFAFEMHGVAKRSVFVIDKEGIIRHMEILESPGDMPNFEQVQASLQALKSA